MEEIISLESHHTKSHQSPKHHTLSEVEELADLVRRYLHMHREEITLVLIGLVSIHHLQSVGVEEVNEGGECDVVEVFHAQTNGRN